MSPVIVGLIIVGLLLLAIIMRFPVAFAMLVTGFAGMLWLLPFQAAGKFITIDIFNMLSSYPFSVIGMFVLMGFFAAATGMTHRLYRVAYVWIGFVPGGLSIATIMACASFSAVCGSSPATAATVGKIAYPEMKRYNYDDSLATGCIAAAGGLGPLIPPSAGLVIYALLTEQSIAKVLVSGIIPGIILALLFAATIVIRCRLNPALGPAGPATTFKEKIKVLPGLMEALILFLVIIGGLFAGWFTPTQAGAAGAGAALLIGLFHKEMRMRQLLEGVKEALNISCMILMLITGSVVFGHFLSLSTIPILLTDWVSELSVSPLIILIIVCIGYVIGGCFIDSLGLIVLTIPIIAPIMFQLGYDPIWFWGTYRPFSRNRRNHATCRRQCLRR